MTTPRTIDTHNLNAASLQEIYDFIAHHLLTQNRKSMTDLLGVRCAYRGDDDCKCAAGAVIHDDHYSPSFEGRTWRGVSSDIPTLNDYTHYEVYMAARYQLTLVVDMQRLHDKTDVNTWPMELVSLAVLRGLRPYSLPVQPAHSPTP